MYFIPIVGKAVAWWTSLSVPSRKNFAYAPDMRSMVRRLDSEGRSDLVDFMLDTAWGEGSRMYNLTGESAAGVEPWPDSHSRSALMAFAKPRPLC